MGRDLGEVRMDGNSLRQLRTVACAVLAVLCAPHVSLRAQEALHVDAGGSLLRGPVDGRIQTPQGGESGTTSSGRPSLAELGIEDADVGDFHANLDYGYNGLYFGGRVMHLSGTNTLDRQLVSQGVTFPAGSAVDADVRFDWYRLGYRYVPAGDRLVYLYPSVGATLLDFHYALSSPGLEKVDRSYAKVGAQVGLDVIWPFAEEFTLTGQVLLPIPIAHWPQILSTQLAVKYRFLERDDLSVSGVFGVDYDWIYYEDSQSTPNDIRANVGPMGLVGLEVNF